MDKRAILWESEKQSERYKVERRERERESLTRPTSPALFSEGTCCAILGRGPASEKREAEEVQQDGEKGKMGGRSRAGCSRADGGQRRPLSRHSEVWMVDWKAGRLAGECTNDHGCSLTFLTKPCLASFPRWLSSFPCHGFLPIIDTEALWEGKTWVEGTGGANSPNNIWGGVGYTESSGQV